MDALTVENLSFSYTPTAPTLRDLSFVIHRGEFLSIVGPNGSGKTTLLRLLDRIYVPQAGRILLEGRDIQHHSRADLARRIAFVPQESSILFPFTVLEMVLMGRSPHQRHSVPVSLRSAFESGHDHAIARRMLRETDLEHLADKPVNALSGGERQRVFIARALAQEPEIILLDEPNAHLDIAHQVDIFALLRRLNREKGVTVVSVSHELNLAAAYSDRIALMLCGSIAALGTPAEVLTESRISEVFRTRVTVDRNPLGGTLRITLAPTIERDPA